MAYERSILFDGGRRIKLSDENTPENGGITLTRDGHNNWNIVIKTRISNTEANNVIFKVNELVPPPGTTFDDAFPNMIAFEAMDDHGEPVEVKFAVNSEIIPSYDLNLGGAITLKMNLRGMAKTQNAKTQNVHVDDDSAG